MRATSFVLLAFGVRADVTVSQPPFSDEPSVGPRHPPHGLPLLLSTSRNGRFLQALWTQALEFL